MKSAHLFAPWKASLQPLEEQWRVALGREAALVLCAVPGQLVCRPELQIPARWRH